MTMEMVRLECNMNMETAAALKQMKEADDISYTEAIRRCIGLTKFLRDERDGQRRILTDDGAGGNVKEVMIP